MAPTIVDKVTTAMDIARTEVFGPVVVAQTFDPLEQAVNLANATDYGLLASVWSRDVDTAVGVEGFGRAPSGSTPSWTERLSFLSVGIDSRESAANSGATPSRTTPRKRRSTSIRDLERAGGFREELRPKQLEGRRRLSEFGSRTVSGGCRVIGG